MKEPKVFLIGETKVHEAGLQAYLAHIGAPGWQSDAPGDVELLSEVMARSCYRSFGTALNPNVTRVRGSNKAHLANLIKVKHGSTLEHAWLNFMFCDVSRVVTHELVRHRAGTAVSQESLRFRAPDRRPRRLRAARHPRNTGGDGAILPDVRPARCLANAADRPAQRGCLALLREEADHLGHAPARADWPGHEHWLERQYPGGYATSSRCGRRPEPRKRSGYCSPRWGRCASSVFPHLFGDYRVEEVDGFPWYHTKHPKV